MSEKLDSYNMDFGVFGKPHKLPQARDRGNYNTKNYGEFTEGNDAES